MWPDLFLRKGRLGVIFLMERLEESHVGTRLNTELAP